MAINLRWVGEADYDRIAQARLRCYAAAEKEIDKFNETLRADPRQKPGDFLLAESGAEPVGTTTSLSLQMWVRGGRVPCQGVAYVGTIRTQRRRGGGDSKGVATRLMEATLAKAREREQVVSALMPFRASFYEHFGYGLAERRMDWTIPLSLMPLGSTDGLRYATAADREAIAACRQRFVERGQCDIETSAASWEHRARNDGDGFQFIDPRDGGAAAWATFTSEQRGDLKIIRMTDAAWDAPKNLIRLLRFLGGQRDQFAAASLSLPADLPLNRLLRECQLPHRPVVHAFARAEPVTRMQIRVLDHKRFLEAMHLPAQWSGVVVVAVRETEGSTTRFRLAIDAGRASVNSSAATADITCTDVIWASIVSGDLPARTAARFGLIAAENTTAVDILDAFSDGPAPFCGEYF